MSVPLLNYAAPNFAVGFSAVAASGTTYTSNKFGIITGVSPADATSLDKMGCQSLGLAGVEIRTPWVTGNFYGLPDSVTPVALLTIASTLYAYPIYIPNKVVLDSLNFSVTTGQTGGKGRVGIYADTGAGYPGQLEVESGEKVATGTAVETTGSLATTLTPGIYWLASTFAASSTMPSVAGTTVAYTNGLGAATGWDTAAHALATSGQAGGGISVAFTYAALPAQFTASATLNLNAGVPLVSVGV